jgi:hypothetical protein
MMEIVETTKGFIDVRVSLLLVTGLWWIGFAQYTFANLPNKSRMRRMVKIEKDLVSKGFKELRSVWAQIKAIASY